jgi:hypothetical protein
MAKIKCVESTVISSKIAGPFFPKEHTSDHLEFVINYGDDYRVTIAMNALSGPVFDAIHMFRDELSPCATLAGWRRLTTYLNRSRRNIWVSAVNGKAESLDIWDVHLDYEHHPRRLWIIGSADFHGTWSEPGGPNRAIVCGTAGATLDNTPGFPGFMGPGAYADGGEHMRLRGMALVGKQMFGKDHIPLTAFDSAIKLDTESVYHAIAGSFYGDDFTWHDFMDCWEELFDHIVFEVHIREVTYKLTIFQALDVYQEEMTHYINLMNYRHNKELGKY